MRCTRSLMAAFMLALIAGPGALGAYTLKDNYTPSSFFSMFNFFTVSKNLLTTCGLALANKIIFSRLATLRMVLWSTETPFSLVCVDWMRTSVNPVSSARYLDQATAASQGLISSTASSVYIGADHSNTAPSGRSSIRIQSKKLYTHGLFILDLAHMPGSICGKKRRERNNFQLSWSITQGTWPSFWTYGSQQTWPANGEIGESSFRRPWNGIIRILIANVALNQSRSPYSSDEFYGSSHSGRLHNKWSQSNW